MTFPVSAAPRPVSPAAIRDPFGPRQIYANIPVRDEYGRDQLAMFRLWNPDPLANHAANLRALDPRLAAILQKAQADRPDLRFVIGSGRRTARVQRMAVRWRWSYTRASLHRTGKAVDLWPLDEAGRVTFDPRMQADVAAGVLAAAAALGTSLRWGERFNGFKDKDRSHFELAR